MILVKIYNSTTPSVTVRLTGRLQNFLASKYDIKQHSDAT